MNTKTGNSNQEVMSAREKEIIRTIIPESPPLAYPTQHIKMAIGPDAVEFVIPEKDKVHILRELFPFTCLPEMDDELYDLHAGMTFRAGDFKVIREDNRNYLVSPFYSQTGGMVIDWISEQMRTSAFPVFTFNQDKTRSPKGMSESIHIINVINAKPQRGMDGMA